MIKMQRKDWLMLIIPLVIVALIYPFLPDRIPRQIGFSGDIKYAAKEFIFILAFAPFLISKSYKKRKN